MYSYGETSKAETGGVEMSPVSSWKRRDVMSVYRTDRRRRRMCCMTVSEAREFSATWLPAWTGNNPELLVSFYAEDAYYSDPAIPAGVQGGPTLLAYFRKLLARNPDWVWRQVEAIPLEGGFLNKWEASIPVGTRMLIVTGVCLVQFNEEGKIRRNEVYFDRYELLSAIAGLHGHNQ